MEFFHLQWITTLTLEVTLAPVVLAVPSLLLSAGLDMGLASAVRSRPHRPRPVLLEPMDTSDTDGALSDPPRLPRLVLCCFFLKIEDKRNGYYGKGDSIIPDLKKFYQFLTSAYKSQLGKNRANSVADQAYLFGSGTSYFSETMVANTVQSSLNISQIYASNCKQGNLAAL